MLRARPPSRPFWNPHRSWARSTAQQPHRAPLPVAGVRRHYPRAPRRSRSPPRHWSPTGLQLARREPLPASRLQPAPQPPEWQTPPVAESRVVRRRRIPLRVRAQRMRSCLPAFSSVGRVVAGALPTAVLQPFGIFVCARDDCRSEPDHSIFQAFAARRSRTDSIVPRPHGPNEQRPADAGRCSLQVAVELQCGPMLPGTGGLP